MSGTAFPFSLPDDEPDNTDPPQTAAWLEPYRLTGRPLWSPDAWTPLAARALADRVWQMAQTEGGGYQPVIVAHGPDQQHGMAWAALLLHARIRRVFPAADLLRAQWNEIGLRDEAETPRLIMDAPDLPAIHELLLYAPANAPLILFGEAAAWQQVAGSHGVALVRADSLDGETAQEDAPQEAEEQRNRVQEAREYLAQALPDASPAGKLFGLVAYFDRFEIPAPLSLAARMLGLSEAEVSRIAEESAGVVSVVDADIADAQTALLCTPGPALARDFLGQEDRGDDLRPLRAALTQLEPSDPDHRRFAWTLALALVRHARRGWLRRLAADIPDTLERIWRAGETGEEYLAWGRALSAAHLYTQGAKVFEWGLSRIAEPEPALLHGAATLQVHWAQTDAGQSRAALRRALEYLDRLSRSNPGNPYALHTRGEIERLRGDTTRALHYFKQLRSDPRSRGPALVSAIAVMLEGGDEIGAKRGIAELEQALPGHPYTLHLQGRTALMEAATAPASQAQDYAQAESFFRQALGAEPANVPTRVEWAKLARERGQFALARQLLTQALEVDAENVLSRHSLAELDAEARQWGAAQTRLDALRAELPANVPVLVSLARLGARRRQEGDETEALERLLQAQTLEPDTALTYAARLDTLLDFGRVREASRLMAPNAEGAAKTLLRVAAARLAGASGDLARARALFEKALSDPLMFKTARVLNAWAQFERQTAQDAPRARQLLEQSLALDMDNAYTRRAMADTLNALGLADEAQGHLGEAKRLQERTLDA